MPWKVSDWENEDGPVIGADPEFDRERAVAAAEAKAVKAAKPKGTPSYRCMLHFQREWTKLVKRWPEITNRPFESQVVMRKFIDNTFFKATNSVPKTEEEVRQLIDHFIERVASNEVRLKDGQSGWQCFTGNWGRERRSAAPVKDDYAAHAKKYLPKDA